MTLMIRTELSRNLKTYTIPPQRLWVMWPMGVTNGDVLNGWTYAKYVYLCADFIACKPSCINTSKYSRYSNIKRCKILIFYTKTGTTIYDRLNLSHAREEPFSNIFEFLDPFSVQFLQISDFWFKGNLSLCQSLFHSTSECCHLSLFPN